MELKNWIALINIVLKVDNGYTTVDGQAQFFPWTAKFNPFGHNWSTHIERFQHVITILYTRNKPPSWCTTCTVWYFQHILDKYDVTWNAPMAHGPGLLALPPPLSDLLQTGCAHLSTHASTKPQSLIYLWDLGRAYPEGGGSHTLEGLPGAERVVAFLKVLQYVVFLLQASSNSPPLCAGCAIKSLASKSPLLLLFHSTCTL